MGVEKRGREGREGEEKKREIDREEIREVMKKIKRGKAAGIDEIPAEAWKYGGEEVLN